MLFPVRPDVFDRVQFRRIAGKVFHPQALALRRNEVASELAAVRRQTIPDDQQGSDDMTKQCGEKVHHFRAFHRTLVQPEVEVAQGNARGGRKRIPIEVVLQDRSLAASRPGSDPMGPLAYSAFVDEDDRSPFGLGFFLIAGHSTRRQWRMPASLRSRARPTGRWQLHPRASRIFQTWPE